MTWVPFARTNPRMPTIHLPAKVGCSRPSGRVARYLSISLEPDLLPAIASWWVAGKAVDIALGTGEQEGLLRLSPGREHTVGRGIGGRNHQGGKASAPLVRLLRFPGLPPQARKPAPCAVEFAEGGAVIVHLPAWIDPAAIDAAGPEMAVGPSPVPNSGSAPKAVETPIASPQPAEKWSADRVDLLRAEFPIGTGMDAILGLLTEMPGPMVTRNDVLAKAALLGLKRPRAAASARQAAA